MGNRNGAQRNGTSRAFFREWTPKELHTVNPTPNIRVQMDLDSVPRPAASAPVGEETFEQTLTRTERAPEARQPEPLTERVDSRNPDAPIDESAPRTTPESHPDSRGSDKKNGEANTGTTGSTVLRDAPPAKGHIGTHQPIIQEEGSSRLIQPGKGFEPSSVFPSPSENAKLDGAGAASAPAFLTGQRAAAANSAPSGTGRVGGVEGPQQASRSGTRLGRPGAPVFRTYDAKAMEMAEARASVFKQIALKMLPDGGRMMVRLDPPQLGQLDIRMTVEKGAVVQLSIGAERADVAGMLERHLPELKQHLAAHGLSIEGAEVFTRDFKGDFRNGADRHNHEQGHGTSQATSEEADVLTDRALRNAGYITAEGLDFWV